MKRLVSFSLLILIAPAIGCGADFSAKVIGVSDGDTITVLRDRTQVRVRLHGIDAPETGQPFASRAKQAASDLAFSKTVTVHPVDTDRYGRTVAEVFLPDGRSLSPERACPGNSTVLAP